MLTEIRFALRKLRQSPGFTSIAVFTLAVGIGMNTAIFSLMHDLFLRGLAFAEPSRVVRIYGEAKERDLKQLPFSVPKFWHYRDGQNVFSSIAADWRNGFIMTGQGDPVQLLGANVTANYFDLLGIRPILGRNFLPQEELNADVTLVTESFWRKRFNSDAMVLGRSITLNGIATTIVGVLPDLPISWFGRNSEIFVTKPFEPSGITKDRLMRGVSFMRCTARLKPGVTIGQAQAAMAASSLGAAEYCLDRAIAYAGERAPFGKPLSHNQGIQFPIVELVTQCEMLRALIRQTAWKMDEYGAFSVSKEVSMCNYWANRLCCEAADRAMQVFGGLGYSRHQQFEHIYRHHRRYRITEGSEEIQMRRVAGYLFGFMRQQAPKGVTATDG